MTSPLRMASAAAATPSPGANAPGYCNVARSAGWVGTGVVKARGSRIGLGLTPQAIAMAPAPRAAWRAGVGRSILP